MTHTTITLSREQVEKCLRDASIIRFSTDSHVEALRAALAEPVPNASDWAIDTSAGRPILVYQGCSVIEAETAYWLLSLVLKQSEPQTGPTLVSYAEDMSTCTLTTGDGTGYFYDRVDAEPVPLDTRWKLVPVEPADAMVQAAIRTPCDLTGDDSVDQPQDYRNMYAAMLGSAPVPPAGEPSPLFYISEKDLESMAGSLTVSSSSNIRAYRAHELFEFDRPDGLVPVYSRGHACPPQDDAEVSAAVKTLEECVDYCEHAFTGVIDTVVRAVPQLQAEVERLKAMSSDPFDRMRDLQSELTKARELLDAETQSRIDWSERAAVWVAKHETVAASLAHAVVLMAEFCARVDAGEVRSKRTYAKFKDFLSSQSAPADKGKGGPVAWFTDDHLTDKSATTYDVTTMQRWKLKGWPVNPLYAEQPAPVAAAQTCCGSCPGGCVLSEGHSIKLDNVGVTGPSQSFRERWVTDRPRRQCTDEPTPEQLSAQEIESLRTISGCHLKLIRALGAEHMLFSELLEFAAAAKVNSQPAPVAVDDCDKALMDRHEAWKAGEANGIASMVMPDFDTWYVKNRGVIGTAIYKNERKVWNACLDEVARLNPEPKP